MRRCGWQVGNLSYRAWEPASPLGRQRAGQGAGPRVRWRRLLDDGVYGTLDDLAKAERVSQGYVSRVLRLTLLAPQIVETILDGRQPEAMRLEDLLGMVPVDWLEQAELGEVGLELSRLYGPLRTFVVGAANGRNSPFAAALDGRAKFYACHFAAEKGVPVLM